MFVRGWGRSTPDRAAFPAEGAAVLADGTVEGDIPKKRGNLLDEGEDIEQAPAVAASAGVAEGATGAEAPVCTV